MANTAAIHGIHSHCSNKIFVTVSFNVAKAVELLFFYFCIVLDMLKTKRKVCFCLLSMFVWCRQNRQDESDLPGGGPKKKQLIHVIHRAKSNRNMMVL